MTATITVKARAVPVTVKLADDAEGVVIQPWTDKAFHAEGSMHLTITEGEPAADTPAEPETVTSTDVLEAHMDEASDAAATREEEASASYKAGRGRRAPAADSDSTQAGE